MNKTLILVLAVCLVSVHGFVKRDAPEQTTDSLQKIKELGEQIQGGFEKAFNPENVKQKFNELVEGASEFINNLKPKDAPKA